MEGVLGKPYDAHNSLADANILLRVMMKTRVEPDIIIAHSFTLQWFGSYNNFIAPAHRNLRMPIFTPIARTRVVSTENGFIRIGVQAPCCGFQERRKRRPYFFINRKNTDN